MDVAGAMSNKWIPSKVGLNQELPVMLNAPFASIKQENYYTGDSNQKVAKNKEEEWESCENDGTINSIDNKTGIFNHKSSSLISSMKINERVEIDAIEERSENDGTINSIDNKTEIFINESSSIISPVRINHRVQIDVIEIRDDEFNGTKNVLIYEEQYSKFIVLKALKSSEPREVANKIVDIVTTIGAPRIIQSGNGRDYAEQVVREIRILLRDFCVVHGDATKNTEVRRDFKIILKSWMMKNSGRSLHDCLRTIQIIENTTTNVRFGKIPSQLFFGRNLCDDLRRTIGAKGSMGNILAEQDTITGQSKIKYTNRPSSPIPISEIESSDKSAGTNENNFNLSSVKSESPIIRENNVEIHSKDEKSVDSDIYEIKCKICEKQYMRLGSLKNHMKTHTRINNFECSICHVTFRISSLYDKHMEQFHEKEKGNVEDSDSLGEKMVNEEKNCSPKRARMEEKPRKITIDENNEKKASLRSFGRKLLKKSKLRKKHKINSTSTKLNENPLLECTHCKQKFNFPSVLKRHMRSHTNERPYLCQICNKSFKQLGHLSQHSLTHTDYRSFQCTVCAIKFGTLDLLKLHSHTHKNDATIYRSNEIYRLFECDSCKKVFTTKSVLERHIFTHTHERQFGCKICGKRFKQAGHVKSHMLVHTGERKFECTVCTKRFSLSNSLKKHMYVHNGEKPYQCDVCGARFLEKRNLNGHMMTHTNERPFSCKICGKRYTLADTLRRHISAAHEDGRTYQCEICAKMFKQLAHLSVHKKVHNDERPFQCHLCEKNFKHKNVLKSHLAIHANVRPFECDICKATFVRKTNLQTHIASAHMNERPYVCTICNKRFKQISHLNGHIVVHSNSMPYKCDFCDRRCNRLDNLKKHMRLHTKNK